VGERGLLPFRRVKLFPGSMPLTMPLICAPGGDVSVTSMVSPMNWFDMSCACLSAFQHAQSLSEFCHTDGWEGIWNL
jgi:hypothetical protein